MIPRKISLISGNAIKNVIAKQISIAVSITLVSFCTKENEPPKKYAATITTNSMIVIINEAPELRTCIHKRLRRVWA